MTTAVKRRGMRNAFTVATVAVSAWSLGGCVTTEAQADGSTKVKVSVADALGIKRAPVAANSGTAATPSAPTAAPAAPLAGSIKASRLAGYFTAHPYDGTSKTYFPRVALSVTDWSRSDCWTAVATIWTSPAKSETVAPFSVCWGTSLGFAVNNAANLHLFVEQSALEHSGNVRTNGPKAPMFASPDNPPVNTDNLHSFIQQLVVDTGWKPGAPTNFWITGFEARSAKAAPVAASSARAGAVPAGGVTLNAATRSGLEQALACKAWSGEVDDQLEKLKLKSASPFQLDQPIMLFGLPVSKVMVEGDTVGATYNAYFPGLSKQQIIKAAGLKLGKDKINYGRITKVGYLSYAPGNPDNVVVCNVDFEGDYQDAGAPAKKKSKK